jgi:hypothetical protein
MVWKRDSSSRIHHRNGVGGHSRERSCSGSASADAHFRIAHSVLFYPGGLLRFRAGLDRGSTCFRGLVLCEDGIQDRRVISHSEGI